MVSPSGEEKVEPFSKESGSGDKSPRRWSFPSRSPLRRTRDTRRSLSCSPRHQRKVIVEHVITETGGFENCPQLMKTKYDTWSLLMKLKLQACHLWDIIEFDDDNNFHDDRTSLEAICSGVPPDTVPTIVTMLTTWMHGKQSRPCVLVMNACGSRWLRACEASKNRPCFRE